MNILIGILMVILGITAAACAIIGLYIFWFVIIPDLWKMITKKQE